ncbi:MAG: 3-deoxy-D-manno-octulosonic acid transferase [Vicinamibacterales bacterium]|nr:3-deoxy-D-manno-octulosonic acid transferase [Vicinamibacterales bacterium]
MYFLYSLFALALFVVVSPWLLYQAIRHGKYVDSLAQRLGSLPVSFNMDAEPSIWIHAVSVGETLSVRPLIRELRQHYPRLRIFLSTTTMTGQQLARRNVPDVDAVFYFPLDFAFVVRRTLDLVRPRLFLMMETEIWPHLLRECHRRGVKTAIVNGRLSSRSYPRYRLVRPLMRRVLAHVDRFCVQSEESARRFVDLGADPARVTVTGSLKFDSLDAPVAAADVRVRDRVVRYFRVPASRPVLVAGSTMRGEEAAVLRAFRKLKAAQPGALLILAPRHPERFDDVEQICREEGFRTVRRSELPVDAEPRADIVVLDTIGELARIYQVATVAFVGGSLVPTGGHNILEPAVFGKPVVFGPHMQNFAEIAEAFVAHEAGVQVRSAGELEAALVDLMADPVRRARLGAAARALVEANRGAKDRTVTALLALLPVDGPGAKVRPFRVVS